MTVIDPVIDLVISGHKKGTGLVTSFHNNISTTT
jgi:hypothetical protein